MKKRLSLKKLKAPDQFLKALLKVFSNLKHNIKLYLIIGSSIVLITALIVLVNTINNRREERARVQLYELSKTVGLLDEGKRDEAIKAIENEIPRLGLTNAGLEARYILAEIYYNTEDWTNAITNYDFVAKRAKGIFRDLSLLGSSYAKENKGDIQAALDTFTNLKEKASDVYKPVAMLGIARSYKKLGEKNKAIAEYESVILSYPETDYARMASVAKSTL
jgi:tetratricopeptide (TPR) repeat protein